MRRLFSVTLKTFWGGSVITFNSLEPETKPPDYQVADTHGSFKILNVRQTLA